MRVLLQRVSSAKVTVEGLDVAEISDGLLLLAGFSGQDTSEVMEWMTNKILRLRIFQDSEGKMNRSIEDTGGDLLIVSQFTLYANADKGTRPSFIDAAPPDKAEPLYDAFVDLMRRRSGGKVASGKFGALMEVSLVNDGPVTIWLER